MSGYIATILYSTLLLCFNSDINQKEESAQRSSITTINYTGNLTCSDGASINITEPDPGEIVEAGTIFAIRWNGSLQGSSCPVVIAYTVDNGSAQIITTSTSDDGLYNWSVPSSINSTNVKIVVAYTVQNSSNMSVGDNSGSFTITDSCSHGESINITEPDPGEVVEAGSNFTILWNSSQQGFSCPVAIAYTVDNGPTQTITNSTSDDGSYSWNVPSSINSTNVEVVVAYTETDANNNAVGDNSGSFTVTNSCSHGESINITEPDPGEVVEAGSTFTILWNSNQLGFSCPVAIAYTVDNGPTQTITNSTSDDGSYNWNVPSSINSTDVEIVVAYTETDANNNAVGDNSGSFTVNAAPCSDGASINITEPDPGDFVEAGSTLNIQWNGSLQGPSCPVVIAYTVDNGATQTIVGNTSDDGSFDWAVPSSINSSNVELVVAYTAPDANNNAVGDNSGAFTINSSTCSHGESINITQPTSGQTFTAGSTMDIEWNGSLQGPSCPVVIAYTVDNGAAEIITGNTSDDGFYTWNIPNSINSTNVEIAVAYTVQDNNNNSVGDVSDPITIAPGTVGELEFATCINAPTSVVQGSSMNITADLKNIGTDTYSGTVKAVIVDSGGNIVDDFGNIPKTIQGGATEPYSTGFQTITLAPDDYTIFISYTNSPTGSASFVNAGNCQPVNGGFHFKDLTVTANSGTPVLSVANPSNGWVVGENRTISWTTTNASGCNQVTIELENTTNNTTAVLAQNINFSGNMGTFSWQVGNDENGNLIPNIENSSLILKIYCVPSNTPVGYSSAFQITSFNLVLQQDILINPASPIQGQDGMLEAIVQNNGNADWSGTLAFQLVNPGAGTSVDMIDPVFVTLDNSNGNTQTLTRPLGPINSNPGDYEARVQYQTSGTTEWINVSGNGFSNPKPFTIQAPGSPVLQLNSAISVTNPLVNGSPATFSADIVNNGNDWTGNVAMHIVVDGQEMDLDRDDNVTILSGDVYQDLDHATNAVMTAPGTYNIFVVYQTNGTGNWQNVSAGNFENPISVTIQPQPGTITVTAPNGGETYQAGQILTPLSWNTTGMIGNISIELESFPVNPQDKFIIADDIPNVSPFSNYTIPVCAEGEYRVKIYETANPLATADWSDEQLTITINPSVHSLTIIQPNGGAAYNAGDQYPQISWNSTGNIGNISIELINEQTNQKYIVADDIPDTSPFVPTMMDVFPNNVPQGEYRFKIYNTECGTVVDETDATFTINSVYDGDCDCTIDNPAPAQAEAYEAVTYLCDNCIIDNPEAPDNDIFPDVPIIKEDLAKITFLGMFGDPTTATYADNFPTPFFDMQETAAYQRYGKVLSYLEYGDGISPFNRRFANYNPGSPVTRGQVCKVFCEAFNIEMDAIFTPFNDVPVSHPEFKYIAELGERGVLNTSNNQFRPNDNATRIEAFIILYRLLAECTNCQDSTITSMEVNDITTAKPAFFDPGNYTPRNLGRHPGFSDANFDSYSATGIYLADRGMPLVFGHSYNSYLTELPDEFFPQRPLGNGWLHTYNSYIVKVPYAAFNNGIGNGEDFISVVWSDGTMHAYKDDGNVHPEKITEGNYDEMTWTAGSDFYIVKKKNQVEFKFEKIDGADDAPYMLTEIKDRNDNIIAISHEVHNYEGENLARVKEVTGTTGRKLLFSYYGDSDKIYTVTDPSVGRNIEFYFGDPNNLDTRLQWYKDAEGKQTNYNYDPSEGGFFLLQKITLPNGNFITNNYFDKKLMSSITNDATTNNTVQTDVDWSLLNGSSAGTTSTMTIHDGFSTRNYINTTNELGKITQINAPTNNADIVYGDANNPTLPTSITVANLTTTYAYDDMGNVTDVQQEMGVAHHFDYNDNNDITLYRNPRQFETTFVYGDTKNLSQINAPIGTTNITYYPYGLVHTVTNPSGILVSYEYDDFGNVEKMTAPENIESTAVYDMASRLKEFYNPNNQKTTYDYDNRNLVTDVTSFLPNNATYQQVNMHYDYDNNGNVVDITNANGKVTHMDYDYFDQLESETFGTATRQYEYDDEGKLRKITKADGVELIYSYYQTEGLLQNDSYATYTYDSKKRLKTVTKDGQAITFNYDNLNRITSTNYDGKTVQYGYDVNSNIDQITYPDGSIVDYVFDSNDRMKTVKWNGNLQAEYFYLLDGRLDYADFGNGTKTEYFYDDAGRIDSVATKNGSDIISAYGFTLDKLGNHQVENKIEPFDYSNRPSTNDAYTYDLNRNEILTAAGNNFTHDNNGNMQTVMGTKNLTYTWDSHDMLTSVSGDFNATYAYDGLGHRREATRNGTTTKYVLDIMGMSRILEETDAGGNAQNYYVYGLGLISRVKPSGDTRYFHYDFRGSTIAMTNENAEITHEYAYDAYGETLQMTEEDENLFQYVGGYGVMQEGAGLLFMRARYCDSDLGRFLSEDPVWSDNLYAYGGNNPVNLIDEKGEFPHILVGALIGGVVNTIMYAASTDDFDPYEAVFQFAKGAASGAVVTATGNPYAGAVVGGAIDGLFEGGKTYYNTRDFNQALSDGGREFAVSSVTGLVTAGIMESSTTKKLLHTEVKFASNMGAKYGTPSWMTTLDGSIDLRSTMGRNTLWVVKEWNGSTLQSGIGGMTNEIIQQVSFPLECSEALNLTSHNYSSIHYGVGSVVGF